MPGTFFLAASLVTLAAAAAPARVVTLAPFITELAFEAGIGDRVVGVSAYSDYPSAAWVSLTGGTASSVHVSAAGQLPEDGFTGYVIEGGAGTSRWGDYHAATADEAGNLWMSVEYIPNAPRTLLANWGTHITMVAP